jgi:Zn-dependent protease with chaperone function
MSQRRTNGWNLVMVLGVVIVLVGFFAAAGGGGLLTLVFFWTIALACFAYGVYMFGKQQGEKDRQ